MKNIYRQIAEQIDALLSDIGLIKGNKFTRLANKLQELLLNSYDDSVKTAIGDAIRYLKAGSGKIGDAEIREVLEMIESKIGKSLAAALRQNVADIIVESYKSGQKIALGGIALSFNQADMKALKWLENDTVYWIGEYYDKNIRDQIREGAKSVIDEGLSRDEAGNRFQEIFGATFNRSSAYWEGLSNHVVTRSREFGAVEGYQKAGVTYLKIDAVLDDRTSEICRQMHGRIIPVKKAVNLRDKLIKAKNPEEVKSIAPWLDADSVRDKLTSNLPEGMSLPPYHFNCRTRTIAAYDEEYDIEDVASIRANDILKRSGNKYEILQGIDNSGKLSVDATNNLKDMVEVKLDQGINIRWADLAIHNHPLSSSLSPHDILMTRYYNIKEARAVAPNSVLFGEGMFYVRRKGDKWGFTIKEFIQKHKEFFDEVDRVVRPKFDSGEWDSKYATNVLYHRVNEELAKYFGYEYGFIAGIRKMKDNKMLGII